MNPWFFWSGLALTAATAAYSLFALLAVSTRIRPASRPASQAERRMPVTILKPLCGAEAETYECLRSFCVQDYPQFQIVFGVADHNDPVLAIVDRLQAEFPMLAIDVAIDRRQHGSSRKVSNLVNMMPLVRYEYLVISDSDVRVERDYLARLVPPLLDGSVGIVTCPYRGVPRAGLWASLGAQFINEWFMPSVRVAALGGSRSFAFGSTIALSRQTLGRIGGFMAIANQLADDYRLGEMTRCLGLRTVLSDVVVETSVTESTLGALVRHELRWLRTIRAVRPLGYFFSFITFGMPVAILGTLLSRGAAPADWLLAMTACSRVLLHFATRPPRSSFSQVFLLPLRDVVSIALWSWSFVTRRVRWRDHHYRVMRDGSVLPVARA